MFATRDSVLQGVCFFSKMPPPTSGACFPGRIKSKTCTEKNKRFISCLSLKTGVKTEVRFVQIAFSRLHEQAAS